MLIRSYVSRLRPLLLQKRQIKLVIRRHIAKISMEFPEQMISKDETTFQYDDSRPPLPIPPLSHTLKVYLESVKPHTTEAEYSQTAAIVKQFEEGEGQLLNNKLHELSKDKLNWLEEWWDKYAYLTARLPMAPFMNIATPELVFQTWPPQDGTQVERATIYTWLTMKFWQLLRREQMPIDRSSQKVIFTMNQFRRIFSTCRIPGEEVDKMEYNFRTEAEGQCPTHAVVGCRGRMFRLETMDKQGELLTAPELQVALQHIRDECDTHAWGDSVGSLTALGRTDWAQTRKHIMSLNPNNEQHMKTIETAIFILGLSERSPHTEEQLADLSLKGDQTCWFDKSINFIVNRNGTIGLHGDHTPCEGMAYVVMLFYTKAMIRLTGGKWWGSTEIRKFPMPNEIKFQIDEQVTKKISESQAFYNANCSTLHLTTPYYEKYGRTWFKQMKLHADTFVQMAIQFAYYRMYNRPAPTYETATTRKFWHGRTETVRSCTMDSLEWSKAMLDPECSREKRAELLKKAIDKHLSLMSISMENHGCDRHLFGLYVTAVESGLPVPELFTDPAYTKSGGGGNYILSTSFVGFTPTYGSVAPMCKNGYGIFYCILNDSISFVVVDYITDEDTDADKLYKSMASCLDDMRTLLGDTPPTNKAAL